MDVRAFDAGLDVQLWMDCEDALNAYLSHLGNPSIRRRDRVALVAELYGQALNSERGCFDERSMVFAVGVLLKSLPDAQNDRPARRPEAHEESTKRARS